MRKAFCFIVLLSQFFLSSYAQEADDIEVKRERTFTGAGLYGFMNGGADLFLEYGVRKLLTRDLLFDGEEYTLDLYEMPSPEDAYGIYSVHVFKCNEADHNGRIDCLSDYQLQTVAGNYYVSLVFTSGSKKASANAGRILSYYLKKIDDSRIGFPEQLKPPYSGVVKFVRGRIALSAVQMALTTLLDGFPYTGIWLTKTAEDEVEAFVSFDDDVSAARLQSQIASSDLLEVGKNWIYLKSREAEKTEDLTSPFGF
ncbi:MAG: hypothetical protein PHG27_01520 [Massilibacteroides sp.]|nr:hypothetical protein [Massilibacteroides sp.]MDD4114265.1 hypothetical protein [Massilibacteroides sp.]MDD4660362.1 hypothetical protein [Massilibacteroides sp.]